MRAEISMEQAILLGIIIVIAVAVSWYMYTTFLSYVQSGARISVSQATVNGSGYLQLVVTNQGPANSVVIIGVYINNVFCRPVSAQGPASISGDKVAVSMGGAALLIYSCSGFAGTPGTNVQGYLVLATGASFPFTASVT